MQIRALCRDDDAISSVLGVVLMVAVTIVLAAVVGTFVLGIGSDLTDESPSVSFEYSADVNETSGDASVTILHSNGDPFEGEDVEVTVGGETVWQSGGAVGADTNATGWDGEVSAGDRLELELEDVESGEMLRVIWSGDDTASIIGEEDLS